MPEIHKYMDASVKYILAKDAAILEDNYNNPVITYGFEFGWWLYVPDPHPENDEMSDHGYSAAFIQLIKVAQEHDCVFIKLDRDGGQIEGLAEQESW